MGWESKVEPVLYAGLSAGALLGGVYGHMGAVLGGVVGCGALFAEQAMKARAAAARAAYSEAEVVVEREHHTEMVRRVVERTDQMRAAGDRQPGVMRRHLCACGHDAVFHSPQGYGCSSCGCRVSREYVIGHQGDNGAPLVQDVVGGGHDTPSDAPIPESAQQMREWAGYKDNADRLTDDEVLRCTKLMGRCSIWWTPCGCGREATYHRVAAQTAGEGCMVCACTLTCRDVVEAECSAFMWRARLSMADTR